MVHAAQRMLTDRTAAHAMMPAQKRSNTIQMSDRNMPAARPAANVYVWQQCSACGPWSAAIHCYFSKAMWGLCQASYMLGSLRIRQNADHEHNPSSSVPLLAERQRPGGA